MLEIIEEALQHGKATCVAFNRRGTLLAAGTSGGSIAIFDFVTRSCRQGAGPGGHHERGRHRGAAPRGIFGGVVLRREEAPQHGRGRKRRRLGRGRVGHVLSRTFDSQLHSAQFCPTNDSLALVCPSDDGPMTLALGRGRKRTPMPQMPGFWSEDRACRIPIRRFGLGRFTNSGLRGVLEERPVRVRGEQPRHPDRGGDGHDGHRPGVPHPGSEEGGTMYVKRLELSRDGARLLAVTTAKEIASYDVSDEVLNVNDNSTRILTPSPSLHNHVSRSQWGAACFSHDGEYVLAASGGAPHELHAWRRKPASSCASSRAAPRPRASRSSCGIQSGARDRGGRERSAVRVGEEVRRELVLDPTYVELEENVKLADDDDDEFDAIARNTTDAFRRSLEEPEAVALDMAVEAAAAVTAAETREKNQSDFDDRSHAFEQWAAVREGTTAPERPTWRDPIMMDDFKRRSEGFDAWAREKEGVPLPGLPARNEALTLTLDELLGSGRSDAAEDAAQRAHAASLKRSTAIKAAEEARAAGQGGGCEACRREGG